MVLAMSNLSISYYFPFTRVKPVNKVKQDFSGKPAPERFG